MHTEDKMPGGFTGPRQPMVPDTCEARYRHLVENVNSIILCLDGAGRITFLNSHAAEFFGYTPKELLGQFALGTVVPPIDSHGRDLRAMFEELLTQPEALVRNENENMTRDGRRVWMAWSNQPTWNDQGELVEILCVGTDITERRRTEQQLQIHQAVIHSSISAIGLADLDGSITYVNPAYLKLYGLRSAHEVVGTNMRDYFVSHQRAADVREVLLTAGYWTGEGVALRTDGERVAMEVRAQVVRDEEGNPLCLMASFVDITERRQAEQALAAEKERLAVTLRSIGDGVIATDINGNVTLLNRAAEILTGWPQAEVLGRPASKVFEILDRDGRVPRAHPVYEVLVTGHATRTRDDGRLISRLGAGLLVQDTAAPIFDAQGRMIGVVLVFHDITEQEQLREEAYRAQKLESLGILAGGIAHDFNNLITGLHGQLAVTRRRLDPLSRAHEELEEAEKAVLCARQLTQQLLTFASGGTPIKAVFALERLIHETVTTTLGDGVVTCEINLTPDLSAVEADAGQIAQVIANIVQNAVEAMPDGGCLRVNADNVHLPGNELTPLEPGRYVHLSFMDEGPGIAPHVLPRIFDPYFTTRPDGNGLGLTVAYSIVRKHGGYLTANSPPGQGATIEIFLPATDQQPPPEERVEMTDQCMSTGRILVMDDDAMVRKVAGTILRHLGYEVDVANDGEETIALYNEAQKNGAPYDLLILDLTVRGGLGGREALEQLMAVHPNVRALACSGYSNDPVMSNCTAYGFCGIVAKPYQTKDLGDAVSRALAP